MILADLVASEAGVPLENIMLLRHSNGDIDKLIKWGGTVEEYTRLQPIGSKYDYLHPNKPKVKVVVVIVYDSVYGVYEVLGVEKEGPTWSLSSEALREFDQGRGRRETQCRLFKIEALQSKSTGRPILGWEGRTRTPIQRSNGGFFREITVEVSTGTVAEIA